MKEITRRDLERRKAFNLIIATMFSGDENKALRRALRKCRSPEDVASVSGISMGKVEEFVSAAWPRFMT